MGQYLKLFNTHENYEDFVDSGEMLIPNVSHCVAENEVHYNEVLPVNLELWQWFKKAYGNNVTNEDYTWFATRELAYKINDYPQLNGICIHVLLVFTNVAPCIGYNLNPEYRHLVENHWQGFRLINDNETATLDDFSVLASNEHSWNYANCGK